MLNLLTLEFVNMDPTEITFFFDSDIGSIHDFAYLYIQFPFFEF